MYVDYELSNSAGYPVELFQFKYRETYYRYAYHDEDVVIGDNTWTSQLLSRSSFTRGSELDQSGVTLATGPTLPVLELFEDGIPETAVELVIYRTHLTDPDNELWVVWSGEVVSIKRNGRQISLVCEPPEVVLRSVGLRRRYQSTCPYPVYKDNGCKVDREQHRTDCLVLSTSSTVVKVDITDTAKFLGGLMTYLVDYQPCYRYITNVSGGSLTVSRPVKDLIPGTEVTLYRGCDKTYATCTSVFSNGDNYGGFKDMPVTNLFNTKVF